MQPGSLWILTLGGSGFALGLLVVFAVLGAIINAGTHWVLDAAKYLTIVIGIGMVVLGVAMLLGYRLPRLN